MEQTAPAISSTVWPRTRSAIRKPPIWLGVASPDMMMSKAPSASSRVSFWPAASFARKDLISAMSGRRPAPGAGIERCRDLQEILENAVAVLGGDAFGVELHAVHRIGSMAHSHDHAVLGMGGRHEVIRHRFRPDGQRMVAGRREGAVDAVENAVA